MSYPVVRTSQSSTLTADVADGAIILWMEVRLNAIAGSAIDWGQFVRRLGGANEPEHRHWTMRFIALPDTVTAGEPIVLGEFSPNQKSPEVADWLIKVQPAPAGNPPHELLAKSNVFGGLQGFLELLHSDWPGSRSVEADIVACFSVASAHWRPKLTKRLLPKRSSIGSDGSRAVPEGVAVVWRVEDSETIKEITDLGEKPGGQREFVVEGSAILQVDRDLLAESREAAWKGLRSFLVQLGAPKT